MQIVQRIDERGHGRIFAHDPDLDKELGDISYRHEESTVQILDVDIQPTNTPHSSQMVWYILMEHLRGSLDKGHALQMVLVESERHREDILREIGFRCKRIHKCDDGGHVLLMEHKNDG